MSQDASSQVAYAARVLKTPTISGVVSDLADTARKQGWTYEEYLAAVLRRQVADREASGIQVRTRAAHFPQVKTLEELNVDHQPTLRKDVLAHLATSTYIGKADNVALLGPPRVSKTHLAIEPRIQGDRRRLRRPVRSSPPP